MNKDPNPVETDLEWLLRFKIRKHYLRFKTTSTDLLALVSQLSEDEIFVRRLFRLNNGKSWGLNQMPGITHHLNQTLGEKVYKERLENSSSASDVPYIYLWTNRVAVAYFMEHYLKAVQAERPEEKQVFIDCFTRIRGIPRRGEDLNPFAPWLHAERAVRDAWFPVIRKWAKAYTRYNSEIDFDDLVSEATIAYGDALVKHAVYLLGSAKKTQETPFDKKLEFAVRKSICAFIPSSSLACRIPMESAEQRRLARHTKSFDLLFAGGRSDD